MANFKVNDRVRIVLPSSAFRGREGTIWMVEHNAYVICSDGVYRVVPVAYRVDIDGVGRKFNDLWNAYRPHNLAPLTPPAQDEWADAKVKQVTKPVYTEPERVKERAHG